MSVREKVWNRFEQVVAFSVIKATGQVGGARNDKKSWSEAELKGQGRGQQESNLELQ
jgi:hypothetical protein